jgi:hypothetical protein
VDRERCALPQWLNRKNNDRTKSRFGTFIRTIEIEITQDNSKKSETKTERRRIQAHVFSRISTYIETANDR